ncbi:MAG: adenosylcobinamide-GDP ribazoletransferase [Omnitrophica bacterium]|nr:adenosylcobinamide-GDP ribazoletransferase [Candidatus Omnitrophota bacterium]
MKRFLIALQFLTVLPVRIKSKVEKNDFGASLLYFPLVGLLIGLLLVLGAFIFSSFPSLIKAAIILIISIIITGGIHLDGLADTCDGFYGHNPKEKILDIMRDSRIGTMGVAGVVSILLLKFSLIASFPEGLLWKTLLLSAVFSRWAQVMACFSSSYARREGKAKYFIELAAKKEFLLSSLFTLALFGVFMKLNGLILFVVSLLPTFLFMQYMKKRIGGMTGDTIGALSEFAEVTVLLSAFLIR